MQMNTPITIYDLNKIKQDGQKISALSCYDYTTAQMGYEAGIMMMLAGDSAAQVLLGYENTLGVSMDFMVEITAAVKRAAPNAYVVADMPFLSYHTGNAEAIRNAGRFITQANAQMVKIEASRPYLGTIKAISDAGIAVMAHIGITPQNIGKTGRFKAEATTAEMAFDLINLADQMVSAGADCLLLEGTADQVARKITQKVPVPVISCGSGVHCDGQILIAPDIMGLTTGKSPKFAKKFAELREPTINAFADYHNQVIDAKFPDDLHCYHMKKGELEKLDQLLQNTQNL
jgi:3-methyl-2-oxobutanoate hydroxymethyltransferase